MKKTIAVLLCIMMLFSCAATAESIGSEKVTMGILGVNGAFELRCAIPEEYTLEVLDSEGGSVTAMISPDAAGKPSLSLSITYNDLYSDVARLNDLDPESAAAIADSFREEDQVEISTMTTIYGTEIYVMKVGKDNVDYVVFYTIYRGYEIEIVMTHMGSVGLESEGKAEIVPVTDEEIRLAVQFLSELDFLSESVDSPAAY